MRRAVWGVFTLLGELAGAGQLHVKTFTTADGLPHNVVLSLLQDSRGFLWIGTYGGITRFDGHEFLTYDSSRGVPEAWGIELRLDSAGHLWACTNQGLWSFPATGAAGEFNVFLPGDSAPARYVESLTRDDRGVFWAGTRAGLFRFWPPGTRGTSSVAVFEPVPFSASGGEDAKVTAVLADRQGGLWIGTAAGVHHRARDGSVQRLASAGVVTSILEDHRGDIWVAALHNALMHFAGGTPRTAAEVCTTKNGLPSNRVECLYETANRRLLVGTAEGLAEATTPQAGRACQFRVWDLPRMKVGAILEDRDRNLWLGSEGGVVQV